MWSLLVTLGLTFVLVEHVTIIVAGEAQMCTHGYEPKLTYLEWDTLREYLMAYEGILIPPYITGPSLPVLRCRAELAVCLEDNLHCGLVDDKPANRTLCLKNREDTTLTLNIRYQEAKVCKCMEWNSYDRVTGEVINRIPPVLHVELLNNTPCTRCP
ncbi:hypothetical protein Hamer_G012622 [Homarus americanus]|uniref:Uncharacterized protein n=1 Tax=Homarus americanus TaxID=6706 RepID=A0A8J5MQI7_HOMAM|nr:hypothetical protein Hamer_G012622 [Homarus americanus]